MARTGNVHGDDGAWKKLRKKVIEIAARDAHVKVGVLAEKGADNEHGDDGITMVELAAIHEFGSPAAGIPERSFIRATFAANTDGLEKITGRLAKAVLAERMSVAQALGLLGTWGVAEIKKFIATQQVRPRLDESEAGQRTIARKGSSVTLVDTGRLINAIQHKVEE